MALDFWFSSLYIEIVVRGNPRASWARYKNSNDRAVVFRAAFLARQSQAKKPLRGILRPEILKNGFTLSAFTRPKSPGPKAGAFVRLSFFPACPGGPHLPYF